MLFKFGLALLFFLPIIESFNRQLGFDFLLLGSLFVSAKFLWERKIILDKINALWIIMLIVFTISLSHSIAFYRSFFEYLRYIAYFFIFISLRSYSHSQILLKRFYIPMIMINSVLLSLLFVVYSLPVLNLAPPNPNWGPFYGMNLFYHSWGHNHLSDILIFAIPVSIIQSALPPKKLYKTCWLLSTIVFIFLLIISLGRAAIISLAISLFVVIFIKKSYILKWWVLTIGIIAAVFISASFYISNFTRYTRTSFFVLNKFYKPVAQEDRIVYFYKAIVGLQQKPVWGNGLDTYRFLSQSIRPYSRIWYTHNQYLQIFTETGIAGGTLFLSLIMLLLYKSLQKNLNGVVIALLASSMQSLLDYNWQYYSIFLLLWIGFALIYPVRKKVY